VTSKNTAPALSDVFHRKLGEPAATPVKPRKWPMKRLNDVCLPAILLFFKQTLTFRHGLYRFADWSRSSCRMVIYLARLSLCQSKAGDSNL